jgi:hypothetical protein
LDVNQIFKPAQINRFAADGGSVGIEVVSFEDFKGVVKSLNDGAFAGAVGAEEEGDRLEVDSNRFIYAFEVFDGDG